MQIILLERVEKLGGIGDEVSVRPGFARNFLLPQKKALRATEANRKLFEARRAEIEARNAEARAGAAKSGEKIDGESYILIRQAGEAGQLYGSVSARDIADAIAEKHKDISRQAVVLDKPIKSIGLHTVRVRLHAEVSVNVTVNVARSPDEAERQAKGENVITSAMEADRAAAGEHAQALAETAAAEAAARGDRP